MRRGRVGVKRVLAVAPVERAQPALGLQNRQAVAVAAVVFGLKQRGGFGLGRGKQQAVGNGFAAFGVGVDLRQRVVGPAQFGQHFVDDELLGLRLVDRRDAAQATKNVLQRVGKRGQRAVAQSLVRRRVQHAAQQEILSEKLPLHGVLRLVVPVKWSPF